MTRPCSAALAAPLLRLLRPSPSTANARRGHFDYAPAAFHREGIRAFLERRAPRFEDLDE